jgi:hypothetical protein
MRNFYNLSRKFYSDRCAPPYDFSSSRTTLFASDRALLRARVVQERHHDSSASRKNIQE